MTVGNFEVNKITNRNRIHTTATTTAATTTTTTTTTQVLEQHSMTNQAVQASLVTLCYIVSCFHPEHITYNRKSVVLELQTFRKVKNKY
jgi:hypothetical protein